MCALDIYRVIGSTETANELRRMIHVGCGGGVTRRRGGDARNAASGGVVGDEGDGERSSTFRGEMCPQHPETRTTACLDRPKRISISTSKTVYHSVPPAGKTKQKHHEPEQPSNLNDHIRFALRDSELSNFGKSPTMVRIGQ